MKTRIIVSLITLMGSINATQAQIFVGGTLGCQYSNEVLSAGILPFVGYEINDKIAVGTGFGGQVYDETFMGIINPFVRYNFLHKNWFYLDGKAEYMYGFGENSDLHYIGISPSLRAELNEHWQITGDVGAIGAYIYGGDFKPSVGLSALGVTVSAIYRF